MPCDIVVVQTPRPGGQIHTNPFVTSGLVVVPERFRDVGALSVGGTITDGVNSFAAGPSAVTPTPSGPGPRRASWSLNFGNIALAGSSILTVNLLVPVGGGGYVTTSTTTVQPLSPGGWGGDSITIDSPAPGSMVSVVFSAYGVVTGQSMDVTGKITAKGVDHPGTTIVEGPNWQINFSVPAQALSATLTVTNGNATSSETISIALQS